MRGAFDWILSVQFLGASEFLVLEVVAVAPASSMSACNLLAAGAAFAAMLWDGGVVCEYSDVPQYCFEFDI